MKERSRRGGGGEPRHKEEKSKKTEARKFGQKVSGWVGESGGGRKEERVRGKENVRLRGIMIGWRGQEERVSKHRAMQRMEEESEAKEGRRRSDRTFVHGYVTVVVVHQWYHGKKV